MMSVTVAQFAGEYPVLSIQLFDLTVFFDFDMMYLLILDRLVTEFLIN